VLGKGIKGKENLNHRRVVVLGILLMLTLVKGASPTEDISLFFTDDLDARFVALSLGLTVHGSVGILLRAFRKKMLTKEGVISKVRMLETQSSLFITRDLIIFIIKEINEYREQ